MTTIKPRWPGPPRVIVGLSSSYCSVCGGNAMIEESSHIHGGPFSGWDKGSRLSDSNGCRVKYEVPPENPYDRSWLNLGTAP